MIPTAPLYYTHALAAYQAHLPEFVAPEGWTLTGKILIANDVPIPEKHLPFVTAALPISNIFGYVATNQKLNAVMVAYKGTTALGEWLKDLEVEIAPGTLVFTNGRHAGMEALYKLTRASVMDLVGKALDTPLTRLLVTGHSLGGALGCMLAFDAATTFYIKPEVVTWASPRWALPGLVQQFNAVVPDCTGIANHWDLIPRLPVPPMFKHCGSPQPFDGGFSLDLKISHSLEISYSKYLKSAS